MNWCHLLEFLGEWALARLGVIGPLRMVNTPEDVATGAKKAEKSKYDDDCQPA